MAIEEVVDAFHRRLKELDDQEPGLWFLIEDDEGAEELGRRGAEFVVAPLRWSAAVGERFDTSELADLLGVTRQAIASRVQTGSLLALPGRGIRWYPRWQVNIAERTVRPVVAELLRAWRQQEPDVDPLTVAAWAHGVAVAVALRRRSAATATASPRASLTSASRGGGGPVTAASTWRARRRRP